MRPLCREIETDLRLHIHTKHLDHMEALNPKTENLRCVRVCICMCVCMCLLVYICVCARALVPEPGLVRALACHPH